MAQTLTDLAHRILAQPFTGARRLVALAGPPAAGKSTLAEALAAQLNGDRDTTRVVPMDGYHLDNGLLRDKGLFARKGAPETFDVRGFRRLVADLREPGEVIYPLFDRKRDIAIAGAGLIPQTCETVLIEGNYLLFDEAPWADLGALWDLSVYIDPGEGAIKERLLDRWLSQGLDITDAVARSERNDLPNARRIAAARLPADIDLTGELQ